MTTQFSLPGLAPRLVRLTVFGLLLAVCATSASAQQRGAQNPPATTPSPSATRTVDQRDYDDAFFRRPTLRLFQNYTLAQDKVTREVFSILADVQIDGVVRGDVIVVMGNATVGPTASIEGSLVVVGGGATIARGATVRRDLVVIGGALSAPDEFVAGGEHVIIGTPIIGEWLTALKPWLTRGILLGRLIVPDIGWVWVVVAFFFVFGLLFNHIFARQVGACADTLSRRPVSAFFVGLLTILVAGPLMAIVAATVIGLPFAIAAFVALSVIGRLGVTRGIGRSVLTESDPLSRAQAFRSYLIGAAILIVIFMVPIAGLLTWALMGVFGFGAATMTFLSSMRKERPAAPQGPQGSQVPPGTPVPQVAEVPQEPAMPLVPPAPPVAQFTAEPVQAFEPAPAPEPPPPAPAPAPAPAAASSDPTRARDLRQYPRASFLDRLVAVALDAILVAIVNGWLSAGYFFFGRGPENAYLAMLFTYHVAFWAWKGTTLGGIICNIRMVRTTGEEPRFIDALVRGLSAIFSVAALFIGCLWMLTDPEKQMWHDKFAGTYVVKVPRELVLR